MTPIPSLDELLERHPAPWVVDCDGYIADANSVRCADAASMVMLTETNWKAFGEAITTLVNRYAEGI